MRCGNSKLEDALWRLGGGNKWTGTTTRTEKTTGPISLDDIVGLILDRTIGRDTLVWIDRMSDWGAAADQPELREYFKPAPPPLPRRRVASASDAPDVIILPPPTAPPPIPMPSRDPIFNIAPPPPDSLAGPWTRYFARIFDLSLLSTALLTGLELGLPSIDIPAYLELEKADPRISSRFDRSDGCYPACHLGPDPARENRKPLVQPQSR
jgi:hypothetical protein